MSRPVNILLLENQPAVIKKVEQELQQHDLAPQFFPALDESSYQAALNRVPDLILADYALPLFTAREALELRNHHLPHIPFIVISDPVGEEKAVEMMRLGATDYLLKDRLSRLGPAIIQALDNKRFRQENFSSEQALFFCEERFRLAVDSIPHPFFLYDENLKIQFVNSNGRYFFGRAKDQILGRNDHQLFPENIAERFLPALAKARAERQPTSVECTLPFPAGDQSFMIHYVPLLSGDGTIIEILALAIDITEWQRIERLKDEMLSAVSHEMRSPLTAILGFSEFLLGTPVNREKQVEYIDIIHKEGERLKELIENILDLQRLKTNFSKREFSPLIIQQLLQKVLKRFQANHQRHSFALDCPINLPLLEGNEAHLYRALENLLSNAVKYSEPGSSVTLGAQVEADQALIWVKDQGDGIAEQFHDQVFDRFFRIKTGNQRKAGGTGLGLALVKEIALEHQGRAWVESSQGKGSIFFLEIPLKHRIDAP